MRLSIVIPVHDEAAGITPRLAALTGLRRAGCEVIVVDGGSGDDTAEIAAELCDQLVLAARGRAVQMNAGAAHARSNLLLFLHADTDLPPGALAAIEAAMRDKPIAWGRFDVVLASTHPMLRVVSAMMNWRSRVTGVATGDQAMFMTRAAFDQAGGFPAIALMEDVAMSKRLKHLAAPRCLRLAVTTSARRWETRGIAATILLMWRLRLAYFLGATPESLARLYR